MHIWWNVYCEKYDDIITIADVESKDYNPWLDDKEINKVLINRQGIIFGGYYLIYTKYDIDPLKMITNDEIYDKYFVNWYFISGFIISTVLVVLYIYKQSPVL